MSRFLAMISCSLSLSLFPFCLPTYHSDIFSASRVHRDHLYSARSMAKRTLYCRVSLFPTCLSTPLHGLVMETRSEYENRHWQADVNEKEKAFWYFVCVSLGVWNNSYWLLLRSRLSLTLTPSQIILSGRRRFFYSYDVASGIIRKTHEIQGIHRDYLARFFSFSLSFSSFYITLMSFFPPSLYLLSAL